MSDAELLAEAVQEAGSLRAVAAKIGYSVTTLSLAKDGKYAAREKVFSALRKVYGYLLQQEVGCPAIGANIHRQVCKKYAEACRDGKPLPGAWRMVEGKCEYCPMAVAVFEKKKAG